VIERFSLIVIHHLTEVKAIYVLYANLESPPILGLRSVPLASEVPLPVPTRTNRDTPVYEVVATKRICSIHRSLVFQGRHVLIEFEDSGPAIAVALLVRDLTTDIVLAY